MTLALPAASRSSSWRQPSILPGFGLSLGITISALSLIVLIPLAALFLKAASAGPADIWAIVTSSRTQAALRLSFGAAAFSAIVNAIFGLIIAWVLVRYRFPGRRLLDAAVDLPFALPTAVAGISLAAIYAPNGWIGSLLAPLSFKFTIPLIDLSIGFDGKVAYTPLGVMVALIFIGLPFVVRTVQPVLEEAEVETEEAAALLGASRLRTIFRVILPGIVPALLTGFVLAFARAVGEYGSVIFIAGNVPMVSEIAPLLIVIKLEGFDYAGASVVAMIMLIVSFTLILAINAIQAWSRGRLGHG
ncbi:sulfate ABC transporter permease subunit CysT [Bosea caraganae]|uniref:Sulfate transport system permease protein CysT n=1 Tax=Bosea caraganae TaxID=2763117 RepID=A0A370L5L4_9HYPH|nr:sulfate ABC transporter permease subunit CysT [Bosea caraganae]RDJ24239.1 sulfate ABC transporter permease subunit CysT [Bosea caraganae]RDJ30281.1 sulfate ABC transporter permease subunit CysT [Bosea caraganae]